MSARRRCAVTPGEDAAGEEEHGRRALRQMPCPCGVSALPRPARIRGPCSAHAIPRAGQLVGLRGGARLERVVPGRPSRVARGEGDETDAALRARGARASIAWHGAAASEELLVLVLLATMPVQGVRRFTALSLRPRATLPVRSCGRNAVGSFCDARGLAKPRPRVSASRAELSGRQRLTTICCMCR